MAKQPNREVDISIFFDAVQFKQQLKTCSNPIPVFKQALTEMRENMDREFLAKIDISRLIYGRSQILDLLLTSAWELFSWPAAEQASLIAVGGYGRGELHPHSDIDLLLLFEGADPEQYQQSISGFLTLLWDIKLDVGSSVRNIQECYEQSKDDITIATNLIESRTITGDPGLRQQMYERVISEKAWSAKDFLQGKLAEQKIRHQRTNNTEYNLEPNLKNSPGGLRDIHTIGWVGMRYFGATFIHDLLEYGFITSSELTILNKGWNYLWKIRYALHMINNKREDRLLFDHQRSLAELFGYRDQKGKLAVEQFMGKYYRVAMQMAGFNELLLQHFEETLASVDPRQIVPLNNRFQLNNNFIEVTHDKVFKYHPFALMELFVLLAQNRGIAGVRASTIRLIREHWYLIDDNFRSDIRNISLFMELLRQPDGVSTELKRMIRYGILGLYLPEFGRIVGQMQHDLFHIYTVDAHTVKVVRKCRQFRHLEHREQFPIAHRLVNQLPKIELLYIAALYHDIGKGRGGDHSELGSIDAIEFCKTHRLGKWDSQLIAWLVRNHLLMSMTAQRKDISDPEIIQTFAEQVGDITHLDYLYVLTVADINATNNSLWNNWRASLMRTLYGETKLALKRGLENPVNRQDLIDQVQQEAMDMLTTGIIDERQVVELWSTIGEDYFIHESAKSIAWHTKAIIERNNRNKTLVLIQKTSLRMHEGASEVFIYTKDAVNLFAVTVATLDQLSLSIQDARIYQTQGDYSFTTYTILTQENKSIPDNTKALRDIKQTISRKLSTPERYSSIIRRRVSRQLKLFSIPSKVKFTTDSSTHYTQVEIISPDRPGLLAVIGQVFATHNIVLCKAKISIVGERVVDQFFITDCSGALVEDPEFIHLLQTEICRQLDQHISAAHH
ncbi:MAG: [protein-PII] uridylyltransferase [Pseudomonadales bacterium]|nr:[protein-PII] uridylyltransferase [Pseudomonadales bacterium]NRA15030.1 [protein-PII] uridylyltransferase [Oceanospirillaceae bacterium]